MGKQSMAFFAKGPAKSSPKARHPRRVYGASEELLKERAWEKEREEAKLEKLGAR
jgi:hypothetical protein